MTRNADAASVACPTCVTVAKNPHARIHCPDHPTPMLSAHAAASIARPLRCDGTEHPPTATPPLPFHAWRFDGDDPYLICTCCGQVQDAISGRVIRQGDTGYGPAVTQGDPDV